MRTQFEINDRKAEQIEELKEKLGVNTKKDLFNDALALLNWAVEQKELGRTIASIDEEEDTYKELLMPDLESVPLRITK